jgi:hypothetical protein
LSANKYEVDLKKNLIPFIDYKRIYSTITSVLSNEECEIDHSCLYFSILGARILQVHYNLDPKVYMGLAAFKIGESVDDILFYAEQEESSLVCTENGFHSWVIVDDWVIDFTAPRFNKLLKRKSNRDYGPPKMFQKRINDMVPDPNELNNIGDFFLNIDYEITDKFFNKFVSHPMNNDLLEISTKWYRKPPRKMKDIGIGDGKGALNKVSLQNHSLVGSW